MLTVKVCSKVHRQTFSNLIIFQESLFIHNEPCSSCRSEKRWPSKKLDDSWNRRQVSLPESCLDWECRNILKEIFRFAFSEKMFNTYNLQKSQMYKGTKWESEWNFKNESWNHWSWSLKQQTVNGAGHVRERQEQSQTLADRMGEAGWWGRGKERKLRNLFTNQLQCFRSTRKAEYLKWTRQLIQMGCILGCRWK